MNVTLIGGSGFIGTHLISQLQQSAIHCYNIDKHPSEVHSAVTLIADVRDTAALTNALQPCDAVIQLAAEHHDNVSPASLYYDVNVEGAKNVIKAVEQKGIHRIIFISTVAVYGLNKNNPDEDSPVDLFNDYARSKYEAENILRAWHDAQPHQRTLVILRPTVVFGSGNKGNVYNLLYQLHQGSFIKVGSGNNKKSMAYIGNVVAFIQYCLTHFQQPGYWLFNYVDKPDITMNELIQVTEKILRKKIPAVSIPYSIGYLGGLIFDTLSRFTRKRFSISAIRVKKFCATTQFSSKYLAATGFKPPCTLKEGLEETLQDIDSIE